MITTSKNRKHTNLIKAVQITDGKNKDSDNNLVQLSFKNNSTLEALKEPLSSAIKSNKIDSDVDLDSFINVFADEEMSSVINLVVDIIEEFSVEGYSAKTSSKKKPVSYNYIISNPEVQKHTDIAIKVSNIKTNVRRLQESPPNVINPETFAEEAKKLLASYKNVKVKVIDQKELVKKGLLLMTGVHAASETDCKLVVAEYINNPKSKEKTAYIGKGVCFDSGGLNIKTGSYMRNMKFDKSGACIVLGTIMAIAEEGVKTNVVGIMGMVENLVGPKAQRPDDVIVSYKGTTVEMDNTDAEGRLVLADAIQYAIKDLKVNRVVDIATLTGAVLISLGNTFTGVWATEQKDWEMFKESADRVNELVWRMPFHPDFRKMLDSKVADLKNSSTTGKAGSSSAAEFLKEFAENVNYIHLDVAGTADIDARGTAVMLKTLTEFSKKI
jgi:leucyl aminopeptidase